ncbi:MAG: pyridoxal phosphate-dependent aminotransferase [Bryobacteraceae bacterium]
MTAPRTMRSAYMNWAKLHSHAAFNLATSGVANLPRTALPITLDDIELNGPSRYGYEPLQEALAEKSGVTKECVVRADGTSMANFLAMAALIEPGDEVLIEQPAYELITSTAEYLGASVRRFPRRFGIDPDVVERNLTPQTKLVILTNLHNPSGVYADDETLRQVGELAKRVGARVLVDEVYLDAAFDQPRLSAFHLGPHFVTTTSLTKVYGLSGLRCGWILAEPSLADRMWRLNDLFASIPAHCAEKLSVVALNNLDGILAHVKPLLATNHTLVNWFLDTRDDLDCVRPKYGTVFFPRLRNGSVEEFCQLLREKYDTKVVPGSFFEMPDHFRIGLGGDSEILKQGLERIGHALDDFRKR